MKHLLRKEWSVTRWVHLAGLAIGLSVIPVGMIEPQSTLFMILFSLVMYIHLVFNQSRLAAASRPDNLLLNSLPVTRLQLVAAKYLYVLSSALLYAAYLCLILQVLHWLGTALPLPLDSVFLLMAFLGVLYHLLLMPISYLDARYGTWASMAIYLGILYLPQRLGKGQTIPALTRLLVGWSQQLGNWALLGLLAAGLLAMGALSFLLSNRLYQRAEF